MMGLVPAFVGLAAFALAIVGTGFARAWALRRRILDVPNARSSHVVPTPRGGGIAIVVPVCASAAAVALVGMDAPMAWVVAIAGAAVAWIGWRDDRCGVQWQLRLAVHLLAAASATLVAGACLGTDCTQPLAFAAGGVLLVFAGAWAVNLFNFMDGIDGIAGMQSAFVALAGCAVAVLQDADGAPMTVLAAIGGASVGFLAWNRPPAKIFMGDVGSGYLGFVLFAVPLWIAAETPAGVWPWVVLWATFATDATVTLLNRLSRGERLYEGHRSHLYQRCAVAWRSHGRATLAFAGVNLAWILPLALLAAVRPAWGPALALAAYLPLVFLAWRLLGWEEGRG